MTKSDIAVAAEQFLKDYELSDWVFSQANFDRITAAMSALGCPMTKSGFRVGYLDCRERGVLDMKPIPVKPVKPAEPLPVPVELPPTPKQLRGSQHERLAELGERPDSSRLTHAEAARQKIKMEAARLVQKQAADKLAKQRERKEREQEISFHQEYRCQRVDHPGTAAAKKRMLEELDRTHPVEN